jgi:predicted ATP-dependent endonuclease of OLD family
MIIKNVYIKNFRSIEEANISLKDLSIFIGDNGTGKTAILEAIHLALSASNYSGRINYTDFFNGTDEPITIEIYFVDKFYINIPDGYTEQPVECKKIRLEIKKRERAAPKKAFSDEFVINHWYVPVNQKSSDAGWEQLRKTNGSIFQYTERNLVFDSARAPIRSFYYNKNRTTQLKRGYNSSITSVFNDFNWRFSKSLKEDADDFLTKNNDLKEQILSKIDDKAIKKIFDELNKKLNVFSLENIGISFIESQAPFNSAFLSSMVGKLALKLDNIGSGIEMIVSLLFLETMASLSKENIIIIIDEPELHLHPSLQEKFVQYLKNISAEKQIILSTHSPYFFKNCCSDDNIKLIITESGDKKCHIKDSDIQLKNLPWSPSWGEINFFAYDLPTVEFHNEIYGYLQEKSKKYSLSEFDIFLIQKGLIANKVWIRIASDGNVKNENVTLMTYIRNCIHHPENQHNVQFTNDELRQSILQMLDLCRRLFL